MAEELSDFIEDWETLRELERVTRGIQRELSANRQSARASQGDRATFALAEAASVTGWAESVWQRPRRQAAGAGAQRKDDFLSSIRDRTVESLLTDGSALQALRENWRETRPQPLSGGRRMPTNPYDEFVAFEFSLLIDLGLTSSQSWSVVRRAFPARIGAAPSRGSLALALRDQPIAMQQLRLSTVSGFLAPVSLGVRLQLLAQQDPTDPMWQQEFLRILRLSVVQGTLAVVESADGLVGQSGSYLSLVLAAVRAALELGEESDDITEHGIFTAMWEVLNSVVGDGQ